MAITEKSIRQSSIGMKDSGASLHAVWNSLFVPVSTKGKRKQNGVGAVDNYVNRLAFEVQSCGDQDKVVQGASCESRPVHADSSHSYDRVFRTLSKSQADGPKPEQSLQNPRMATFLRSTSSAHSNDSGMGTHGIYVLCDCAVAFTSCFVCQHGAPSRVPKGRLRGESVLL